MRQSQRCRCRPRGRTRRRRRRCVRAVPAAPPNARKRWRVACSCIGCCNRCRTFRVRREPRPRSVTLRARPGISSAEERKSLLVQVPARARGRAVLSRCLHPGAAPRSRSWAASRAEPCCLRSSRPAGRRRRYGPDRGLQDQSSGPAGERATRRPATFASWRCTARVLMQLYPDQPIRAALVWTDVPDLMEIPAAEHGSRARRPSPRREAALTLGGRVHRFAVPTGASPASRDNEVSHGRWQGVRRELSKPRCSRRPARSWSISGPNGAARAA